MYPLSMVHSLKHIYPLFFNSMVYSLRHIYPFKGSEEVSQTYLDLYAGTSVAYITESRLINLPNNSCRLSSTHRNHMMTGTDTSTRVPVFFSGLASRGSN